MNESIPETQSRLDAFRPSQFALVLAPFFLLLLAFGTVLTTPVALAVGSDTNTKLQAPIHQLSSGDVAIGSQTTIMTKDSNKPCDLDGSGSPTPVGGYLLVFVTNTLGADLNGVTVQLTGFGSGQSPAQLFLGDGETGVRNIGLLTKTQVFPLYFWTKFASPCRKPNETYNYTVTVSDDRSGIVTKSLAVTMRGDISANAGGIPSGDTVGPGVYLGEILPVTITFSNGNAGSGGDLLIEPAANGTSFAGLQAALDTTCFQLIKSKIDNSAGYTGITAGEQDRLYYPSGVGSGGTNNAITATFYYKVLCVANQQLIAPYGMQNSGTQEKYVNQDAGTFVTGTNPFAITKTAQTKALAGGTTALVTWTVTISNTDPKGIKVFTVLDRVTDTLPNTSSSPASPTDLQFGGTIASSPVNPSNSTYSPTIGATRAITWVGIPPMTSYTMDANGNVQVIFTTVLTTFGRYTNTATALVGTTQLGPVTATVGFFQSTAVELSIFDGHADGRLPWLPLALGAVGVLILGALAIVLARKQ